MPSQNTLNLPELARIARSATPGTWTQKLTQNGNRASISAEGFPFVAENLAPVDADYLETFHPAMVTRLISDLTVATVTASELRDTLHQVLQAAINGADSDTIQNLILENLDYVVVKDIPATVVTT